VIPLGLKIIYTLFVCALVPIYWRQYGPANSLWFSDIALLALVPALWLENALLASMLAISVVFFEALWNIDFFFRLAAGKSLIGLSAYMFDPKIPLFIRGLSCFHIVLPEYFSGDFTASGTIDVLFSGRQLLRWWCCRCRTC
jgi:hypothetical protein